MKFINPRKTPFWLLVAIPLLCIFARESAKISFFLKLKNMGEHATWGILALMTLSILSSISLGLKSDKECRKNLLCLTLLGSTISLTVLTLAQSFNSIPLYILAIGLDGVLGFPVIPIARAAYCDTWEIKMKTFRGKDKLLADTILAQAATWIIFCMNKHLFYLFILPLSISLIFISLLLTSAFFLDLRDKDHKLENSEIRSILRKQFLGYHLRLVWAFFFYDLAFQLVNHFAETYYPEESLRLNFLIVEGLGIFAGCLLTRLGLHFFEYFKSSYKTLLLSSLALISVSLIPGIRSFIIDTIVLDNLTLLLFSTVGGVVLTLTFGFFSHRASIHETGLTYGVLEGVQLSAESFIALFFVYGSSHLSTMPYLAFLLLLCIGCLFIVKKEKHVVI